jgi:nitrogen regulatory protein PII
MLKLVVAYVDPDRFEAIRRDLTEGGVSHLAAIAVGSVTPDPFTATPYRGSAHTPHLPEKTRLEFVVRDEQLDVVKEAIFRHAGDRTFVFILTVDEALPERAANPVVGDLA